MRAPTGLAAAGATVLLVAGCAAHQRLWVRNDTARSLVVRGCSQTPRARRTLAPGKRVDLGPDALGDDPGFACWLETPGGAAEGCLRLPTTIGKGKSYRVSTAIAPLSRRDCMALTKPRL